MSLDLTTYAGTNLGELHESDAASYLSTTSTVSSFTAVPCNSANNYQYIEYAAGTYSGNHYLEGELNVTALAGTGSGYLNISAFSNALGATYTFASMVVGASGTTTYTLSAAAYVSGVGGSATQAVAHAKSTTYYYRSGVLSALGQYGGVFAQTFTDSGFTTLKDSVAFARGAAQSYKYIEPILTENDGVTKAWTGTNGNINLVTTAAGIDLTTGVETDTGTDRLVVYADCIVATALNIANSETAKHVAIDEGAGFFGDYTVSGVLNITAFGGSGTLMQYFEILTVCDAAASSEVLNDSQGIAIYWVSTTTYRVYIHQMVGGVSTFSAVGPTLNKDQPYSFTLERSGSTLTLKVWNDLVLTNFAGTSQVGSTITWTGRATTTYRYLLPVTSFLSGATSRSSTFTIGRVQVLGDTITATKGAFSWAGTTATISEQATAINATKGVFSWAGKTSALSLMIQATKGAFSWAGKTVNLNTGGQVNTSPGTFSWGGKSSPLSHIITATKGAFSWAGKTSLLGSTVTSLRTATLTKWDTVTEKEIPDTGLTGVLYMLYDPINLKVYDFSDNTFKASVSCVTPQGTMTERVLLNSVGTNLTPGVYDILLATTGLSGLYQEYLFYYGTTNHLDSNPVRFQDGIEYLGGLTVAENMTLVAVPTAAQNATAVLAAATTTPIATNVKKVNDSTIGGAGTTASPWGPV